MLTLSLCLAPVVYIAGITHVRVHLSFTLFFTCNYEQPI